MYADPFRAAIPRASALRSAMAKLINYSDSGNRAVDDFLDSPTNPYASEGRHLKNKRLL